jgi:hypothetical protein
MLTVKEQMMLEIAKRVIDYYRYPFPSTQLRIEIEKFTSNLEQMMIVQKVPNENPWNPQNKSQP